MRISFNARIDGNVLEFFMEERERRKSAAIREEAPMSLHSNYQTLINRGRKAGLTTRELYSAMSARPPEGGDRASGQADCNGYVPSVDARGHTVYRPSSGRNN